jgi:hypothetical protein
VIQRVLDQLRDLERFELVLILRGPDAGIGQHVVDEARQAPRLA